MLSVFALIIAIWIVWAINVRLWRWVRHRLLPGGKRAVRWGAVPRGAWLRLAAAVLIIAVAEWAYPSFAFTGRAVLRVEPAPSPFAAITPVEGGVALDGVGALPAFAHPLEIASQAAWREEPLIIGEAPPGLLAVLRRTDRVLRGQHRRPDDIRTSMVCVLEPLREAVRPVCDVTTTVGILYDLITPACVGAPADETCSERWSLPRLHVRLTPDRAFVHRPQPDGLGTAIEPPLSRWSLADAHLAPAATLTIDQLAARLVGDGALTITQHPRAGVEAFRVRHRDDLRPLPLNLVAPAEAGSLRRFGGVESTLSPVFEAMLGEAIAFVTIFDGAQPPSPEPLAILRGSGGRGLRDAIVARGPTMRAAAHGEGVRRCPQWRARFETAHPALLEAMDVDQTWSQRTLALSDYSAIDNLIEDGGDGFCARLGALLALTSEALRRLDRAIGVGIDLGG